QVSPKVPGYVKKIYITDNEQVRAGDLLVEIDPRDYEAKLSQARAALSAAIARSQAARASLALIRVTAGAGVEQASAAVESARSGVAQALIYATVQKQSALLASLDVFWLLCVLALAAAPLVLPIKK